MNKLDIGYYTFSFLDQYSRKKVSDIKNFTECKEEINYIKNNFIIINNNNLTNSLKKLCKQYNVNFINSARKMKSNRKKIKEYNFDKNIIDKIKYKDRLIFEIVN